MAYSPHVPFSVVWELILNHGLMAAYKRYHNPMYFKVMMIRGPNTSGWCSSCVTAAMWWFLLHHLRNVYGDDVDLAQLAKGHYRGFTDKYAWADHAPAPGWQILTAPNDHDQVRGLESRSHDACTAILRVRGHRSR